MTGIDQAQYRADFKKTSSNTIQILNEPYQQDLYY